jgi:hypothetical protein
MAEPEPIHQWGRIVGLTMVRVVWAIVLAAVLSCWPLLGAAQSTDQPPNAASAQLDTPPWSGWWWPASDSLGPTLYAPDSPLDKYDRYVANVTGENPGTRAWERQELYFPGSQWAGHCNGFAAAALLEPEPTAPVTIFGITFTVADLKGLLVDYHFADAEAWAFGDDGQLNPADFHRMLLNWVGVAGKGFVLTYDMGNGEVWSYPLYRYDSSWIQDPDDPNTWHVTTTVWMADMAVPPNFVGTKEYPGAAGKTFYYTLQGDPNNPTDGAWEGTSRTGRFAHPGRIWYPEPTVRTTDRDLVSPGLDRQTVLNILAGSDGSDVTVKPAATTAPAKPSPTPTATASPTPSPTATPPPVAPNKPTPTATPTALPTLTPTAMPSPTLAPTLTPLPTPTRPRR